MRFSAPVALLCAALANAAPLALRPVSDAAAALAERQLFDAWPVITSPAAGDVYHAGEKIKIQWSQELASSPDVGQVAHEFLLFYTLPGSDSFVDSHTLASNVTLYGGADSIEVRLPKSLKTKKTYRIALVGSTSDQSGAFTIKQKKEKKKN